MNDRGFVNFIFRLYKPVYFLTIVMAITMFAMYILTACKQVIVKEIIDLPKRSGNLSIDSLYGLVFWLIFIIAMSLFMFYVSNILRAIVIMKIQEPYIASFVFTDLKRRNYDFFLTNHSGKITSAINSISDDVNRLNDLVSNSSGFVSILAGIVTNLFLIYSVDKGMFIFSVLIFTLIMVSRILYFRKKYTPLSKEANAFNQKYAGILNDSIMNFSSLRIYDAIDFFSSKLKKQKMKSVDLKIRAHTNEIYFGAGVNIIYNIIFAFMALFMVEKVRIGAVSLGGLVIFLNSMAWVKDSITRFAWSYLNIVDNLMKINNSYEILYGGEESDDLSKRDIKIKSGEIEIIDLSFSFGDNKVFENINLKIANKEKIGIIGESGGGKSTLINLILKLYSPDSGKILIGGKDISNYNSSSIYREFSYVSQDTVLFHDTILENIRIAKPDSTDEEIFEATNKVQLHDFINSLSDGYDTIVGERGLKLSGGQRQRISLARTFLRNSKVVIFDEATSALDSKTEKRIQENIDKNFKNQTIICIAHRLSTLKNMDKIAVLKGGKIVDFGTPADIISKYEN